MLALANKLTNSTQPIYRFVNKYSIDFDGVDDRIITDGADTVLQNTTYAFWCKASTTLGNNGVFGHGDIAEGAFHFNFSSNRPLLYLGGAQFRYWTATDAQDDGKWHHWVVYLDTDITKSKLYVDSVLQTISQTNNNGAINAYTESLTIGSERQVGGNSFEGKIDEFAVFDRELKQDEITRMYNTYYTPNRVANGNFAQIGNEEVTNGDFSQEGANIITPIANSDFSSDTGFWTREVNITIGGGLLSFSSSPNNNSFYKTGLIVVGKIYKVEITISNYSEGFIDSNNGNSFAFPASNGTHTIYFVGGNAALVFSANGTTTLDVDNLSVKEVGQDWTFGDGWIVGENKAIIDGSHSSTSNLFQNVANLSNKSVKLVFTVSDYSAGTLSPSFFGAAATTGTVNVNANGVYTQYVNVSSGHNGNVGFSAFTTFAGSVTDISIKEVGQNWSFGAGWSMGDNKAVRVASSSTDLVQQSVFSNLTSIFKVSFNVVRSAGSVRLRAGTLNTPYVSATDTYTYNVTPTSNTQLKFQADSSFVGSIDNVVVQELKSDATNLMLNAGAYQSANPLITSTNSMEFDGTDDYLQVGNVESVKSMSFWFNPDNNITAASATQRPFGFSTTYLGITLGAATGSFAGETLTVLPDSTSRSATKKEFDAGRWYHIVIAWNETASYFDIYVDGVLSTDLNVSTHTLTNWSNFVIGSDSDYNNEFNGQITEVGNWDRSLTSLEVASLYNQGMPTNLLVNRNDYQSGNPTVFNTKQVDFDGTDDYLEIGSALDFNAKDFSVSSWYKTTDTEFRIIQTRNTGSFGTKAGWQIGTSSGNNWTNTAIENTSGNIINFSSSGMTNLNDGEWHHIVMTYDTSAGTGRLYADGLLLDTQTNAAFINSNVNSTNSLIIGGANSGGQMLNGEISQSGIWHSVLTDNEVSSLYNHGLPVDLKTNQAAYTSSSNLVGYWRMGSGTLDSFPLIADQTNATLGSNLFVDGDFPTGTTAWNKAANWTISNGTATCSGGAGQVLYQSGIMPVGTHYKLTITVSSYTSGYLSAYGGDWDSQIIFAAGTFVRYTKSLTAYVGFVGNGFIGSIENVSVQKINGNPAIMTNMTASDIENGSPYAQLVQNGTFATDTDWDKKNGSTISGGVGNVIANGDLGNTGANWSLNQDVGMIVGKSYKISFSARQTGGTGNFQVGQAYKIGFSQSITSSFENYTFIITPNDFSGNTGKITIGGATVGNTFEVDSVTVTEVNTGLQGYWKMGDGINDEYPVIYDQTNPTLGAEEVTNGDFTNDSDWNKGTGWTIANGKASSNGSGGSFIYQSLSSLTTGDTLKVVYEIVDYTSGQIRIGFGSGFSNFGTYRSALGTYTEYITKTSSNTTFGLVNNSSNSFIGSIDNVSVKQLQGNPATMTNMVEGNITNQYPLTKIRNYYRMGDGILDKFPCIQDQTSPNLAHIPTTNTLLYSEDFSNGEWSKENSTVTLNTIISPDGTQNATTLTEDTANGRHGVFANTATTSTSNSFSFFAKKNTRQYISIVNSDTTFWQSQVVVDLTDGSITKEFTNSYQVTNKVEDFGNGWYKISSSIEGAFAGNRFYSRIYLSDVASPANPPNNQYTGTGKSAYIWGAQLEAQSQATKYLKSDGVAAVRKATTTNLIPYSEDFSSYDQIQNITLTPNATTSPIGTSNATKVLSTDNSSKVRDNISVVSGTTYTFSVYCKNIDATLIVLLAYDGVTAFQSDVTSQVSTTEWTRVSVTFTSGNTGTGQIQFARDLPNTQSAFFWGAQFEEQTQVETYAKTTGLPVTIDLFTENNYGTMTNMVAGDIVLDTPNNPA